jgi:hypothetical protein
MKRPASTHVVTTMELRSHIFENLDSRSLAACLTVSRLFWEEAASHMYYQVKDFEVDKLLALPSNVSRFSSQLD